MYERKIYVDGTPAVKIVDAFGRCGHFELIDKVCNNLHVYLSSKGLCCERKII